MKELDTAHVQQAFEAAREAQAAAASGGDADTDAKDGDCKADAADGEAEEEDGEDKVSQVAFNMASNAYLVMYRLKNHDAAHHEVKLPPPLAAMVRVGGADTKYQLQHSTPTPTPRQQVNTENKAYEQIKRAYDIRSNLVELEVHALGEDEARYVSLDAPAVMTLEDVTAAVRAVHA